MKIGGERKVEVPGERVKTRLAKKEDLSALLQEILGRPLTIPIGMLLKLVPPLLRSLGQHTKEGQVGIEKGHKGEGRDHPIKKGEPGAAGTKKILLHQGCCSLGQPREGLIVIPVRVGRAKMEAVIDSGAMVDVISEEMFIASGLARNNDTSMQIGDTNRGMKECLGMIKNMTIYLTESELPTVTDLWVSSFL